MLHHGSHRHPFLKRDHGKESCFAEAIPHGFDARVCCDVCSSELGFSTAISLTWVRLRVELVNRRLQQCTEAYAAGDSIVCESSQQACGGGRKFTCEIKDTRGWRWSCLGVAAAAALVGGLLVGAAGSRRR